MRSTFRALLAGAVLIGVPGRAHAQAPGPTRIAYVNPQALFQNAPGRAAAESAFAKETEAYRKELTTISDALTKMIADYQRDASKLSEADRERRERAIGAKEDSLRQRQAELEEVAGRRQSELMAPIMEAVRKVLEDIRVEDGWSMILSSEPGASPILAADKNLDITERVVARLRTMTPPKAGATPQRPAGLPASTPAGVTRPPRPE